MKYLDLFYFNNFSYDYCQFQTVVLWTAYHLILWPEFGRWSTKKRSWIQSFLAGLLFWFFSYLLIIYFIFYFNLSLLVIYYFTINSRKQRYATQTQAGTYSTKAVNNPQNQKNSYRTKKPTISMKQHLCYPTVPYQRQPTRQRKTNRIPRKITLLALMTQILQPVVSCTKKSISFKDLTPTPNRLSKSKRWKWHTNLSNVMPKLCW